MQLQTKNITAKYIAKLNEIEEFRAFTQLAYNLTNKRIDQGTKMKLHLPSLDLLVDENHLKTRLLSYENGYLPQLSFQHAVSIFESWFFDILRHILKNPSRLNKKKKIEVSEIIESNTIDDLLTKISESEINEIRYKRLTEWFQYLGKFVNIDVPSQEEIELISEIKASRDILVHNEGIANQIYVFKTGNKARCQEGEKLDFKHDYVFASWKVLSSVMKSTGDALSGKLDA